MGTLTPYHTPGIHNRKDLFVVRFSVLGGTVGRAVASAVCLAAGLAGCGPSYSPNTYSTAAVQQANKVEQGVVVGVRRVDVSAQGVGSNGVTEAIGALGGSVIGGLVGTAAEHAAGDTFAFEYVVKKANNDLVSVTQKDKVPLAIGQKVLVIAGNQARIVPDYTVPLAVAADKPPETKAETKPGPAVPPAVTATPLPPLPGAAAQATGGAAPASSAPAAPATPAVSAATPASSAPAAPATPAASAAAPAASAPPVSAAPATGNAAPPVAPGPAVAQVPAAAPGSPTALRPPQATGDGTAPAASAKPNAAGAPTPLLPAP